MTVDPCSKYTGRMWELCTGNCPPSRPCSQRLIQHYRHRLGLPPLSRAAGFMPAGLGDAVASVAQPIARGIDWLLGTNLDGCASCDGRRRWLNELGHRLRGWQPGVPLILTNHQSPGDIVVMTGVVRELHRQYPGRFITDVRTSAGELWKHNPHVTSLQDGLEVQITYEGIHRSNQSRKHFMQAMADDLAAALELPSLTIADPRGDLYLSDAERTEHPFDPPEPYWLVSSGVKSDYTAKAWPYYQEVVVGCASRTSRHSWGAHSAPYPGSAGVPPALRLNFVQVGQLGEHSGLRHLHAPLDGVAVNLLGRTNHRDLVHLVAHASGVLCGVSYLMHLAAAFRKPAVIIAGGREPATWNGYNYPGFHLLHTIGALECGGLTPLSPADRPSKNQSGDPGAPGPHSQLLDCCATGGCWKSRTVPLGDGDEQDKSLCRRPIDGAPQCMRLIPPDLVSDLVERITADEMETRFRAASAA